jgi:hypothetical protein
MHRQHRRFSTIMGTVTGFILLAFLASGASSQAAEPTAPPPGQEKAIEKGDPGQVQERAIGSGVSPGPRTFKCSPFEGRCNCNGSYEDCNAMERNCEGPITCAPMIGCFCKMKK